MELILKPKNKWWHFDWAELWRFRDLFYFFTWRDVKVKYKQTVVGAAWVVFQPFVTMIIFSVFFGKLAKMPSDGIPYPIFVYTGLLFWTLFNSSLAAAASSFTGNEGILTKIYFPRVILPVSSIVTNIVDFFIAGIILAGLMAYYHYTPTLMSLWLVPILLIMTIFSTLGISLFLASVNVKYRDVRFILPFFIQSLLFITPVIYPVSIVSEKYRWILGLNPMGGVIDTARAVILGGRAVDWQLLLISSASMVVYCLIGFIYFKKVERYFADVI